MTASFEKYLELAVNAARAAGSGLAGRSDDWSGVNSADGRDIKLKADVNAEKIILAALGDGSPFPILSEEAGWVGRPADGPAWVVDPLDGTYNYSREFPVSCVSIALVEGDKKILGVVYDFNRDEMFSGIVGSGAWLNGRDMRVSQISEKKDAVLMTGFPIRRDFSDDAMREFASDLGHWKKVRMIGSAALALTYVAAGRADYYREENIMPWDVAAGAALVEAAGGATMSSGNTATGPLVLVAANNDLLAKV